MNSQWPSPILRLSCAPVAYPQAMARMDQDIDAALQNPNLFFLWFLEHPSLYTQGVGERGALESLPFPLFKTPRGGKITYHGPGQRIIYVTASLGFFNNDIKRYVWFLEEWMIQCLRLLGVTATRDSAGIGVWVKKDHTPHKIAAIGVRMRKGIVSHGVALNVRPNLAHFDSIVPCGIQGKGVTSLATLGIHPNSETLQTALENSFGMAYASVSF